MTSAISQELVGSVAIVGVLASVNSLGSLFSPIVIGLIVDRFGAFRTGTGLMIFTIAGYLLCSFSPWTGLMLVGIFLIGASSTPIDTVVSPIISKTYGNKSSSMILLVYSFYSIGALVAPVFFRNMFSVGYSSKIFFVVMGSIISICCSCFALYTGYNSRKEVLKECTTRKPLPLKIFKDKFFRLIFVSMIFIYFVTIGTCYWVTPLFMEVFNAPKQAALSLTLFWVVTLGMRVFAGLTGNLYAKVEKYIFALCPIWLAGIAVLPWLWVKVVMMIFLGVSTSTLFPTMLGIANKVFLQDSGFVVGFLVCGSAISNFIGQPLLSVVWSVLGVRAVFAALSVSSAVAAVMFFKVKKAIQN